jgi:OFA family oxalate/formate antiporter-like MFS transporter
MKRLTCAWLCGAYRRPDCFHLDPISRGASVDAYLIMPHLEGIWLWTALAAVIGYAFGTLFAVTAPLAGDCFGMAHFGAIFGLIFTAYGFLSGPLGPWLSGYLLDYTQGNYTLVFSYLGFMYLASAGLILLVQPGANIGCKIKRNACPY